jgi:hypothetical protein
MPVLLVTYELHKDKPQDAQDAFSKALNGLDSIRLSDRAYAVASQNLPTEFYHNYLRQHLDLQDFVLVVGIHFPAFGQVGPDVERWFQQKL